MVILKFLFKFMASAWQHNKYDLENFSVISAIVQNGTRFILFV